MTHSADRPGPPAALAKARVDVAALRTLLLTPSPDSLETQLPALEAAAVSLELIIKGGRTCATAARTEIEALASDLRSCSKLIQHGLALQHALAAIVASAAGGYSPNGQAASLTPQTSICVRG